MSNVSDWLIAVLDPVSLFSLRSTYATSKGGKTLLVPTPYAIKMALVDACFRSAPPQEAELQARRTFDLIKAKAIRIRPPASCIVQHTFVRALQPARDDDSADEQGEDVEFSRTIAYREFVSYSGHLHIALSVDGCDADARHHLRRLFFHVNQIGKRGSFWQMIEVTEHHGDLPPGFALHAEEIATVSLDVSSRCRTAQYLDDFGPGLCHDREGFERISTYHGGKIHLGKHRILRMFLLPYQVSCSSRHFTEYRTSP